MMLTEADRARFMSGFRRDESGCWLWTRSKDTHGYGQFAKAGFRFRQAHKWSWVVHYGVIPELYVLHRCDVPACVNPSHLFLGTQKDNIADLWQKGRGYKRSGPRDSVRRVVLTEEQVLHIYADKRPYELVAVEYGVSKGAVNKIRCGDRWAWLTRYPMGK